VSRAVLPPPRLDGAASPAARAPLSTSRSPGAAAVLRTKRAAFTLLELIVVVAIVTALAGTVVVQLASVDDRARSDVARRQLEEVRQAVLRFRQDTGSLPRRGPFNLAPGIDASSGGSRDLDRGAVTQGQLAALFPALAASPTDTLIRWFDAPGNLSQLYTCPLPAGHPLATWDPERRRGWHGPYLAGGLGGQLSAWAGPLRSTPASADVHGDPYAWVGPPTLPAYPAVPDPFTLGAPGAGDVLAWETSGAGGASGRGAPILLFDVDPGEPGPADDRAGGDDLVVLRARLVSLGPDRAFTSITSYDECVAGDDLGVYLFR
jgi:prepilin-type N-terminal cleavage/methylation domain-containing protein